MEANLSTIIRKLYSIQDDLSVIDIEKPCKAEIQEAIDYIENAIVELESI